MKYAKIKKFNSRKNPYKGFPEMKRLIGQIGKVEYGSHAILGKDELSVDMGSEFSGCWTFKKSDLIFGKSKNELK